MKKFTLVLIAGLFALAGNAQKKVVISSENVAFAEDGTADITLKMDYPTSESVVGYNFSVQLPDGVKGANAKTGKETSTGKVTTASVTLGSEIHPMLYSADDEDYTVDPKTQLQIKDKTDGGILIIWIDQNNKVPLAKTEGTLMTIKVKAGEGFTSGEAKIYDISLTNDKSVSLDADNIDNFTFTIGEGGEQGINDIQAAESNAPAYNLQGVRVNANTKGLIIRDGKKTMVK